MTRAILALALCACASGQIDSFNLMPLFPDTGGITLLPYSSPCFDGEPATVQPPFRAIFPYDRKVRRNVSWEVCLVSFGTDSTVADGCGKPGCCVNHTGPTYHWSIRDWVRVGRLVAPGETSWTGPYYGEERTGDYWELEPDPRLR